MKTRLIFDHLPKTAGKSIAAALNEMFGEVGDLGEGSNMHYHAMRSAGTRRLLSGHLWFIPGEPLAEGWYYCTLLREPVDRFLSQYWFNRMVARKAASHPGESLEMNDPQVRAAAAHALEDYLELDELAVKRSFSNVQAAHFVQRTCGDPHGLSEDELLDAATAALDEYDLVGAFDELQAFVDAVGRDLGLSRVELPRLNVTANREPYADTSAAVIQRLRQANRVDTALHAWALERFHGNGRSPRRLERGPSVGVDRAAVTTPPASAGFGTREVEFLSVHCVGADSGNAAILSGEDLQIVMACQANAAVDDLTLGIAVRDKRGNLMYGTNSRLLGLDMTPADAGTFVKCLVLQAKLGIGEYFVTVAMHKGTSHLEGCYHWLENAASFGVVGHRDTPFEGVVDLHCRPQ